MYYTYVLRSKKDGRKYIGSTADLKKRLKYHNRGSVKSTKFRRPLEIEYVEKFDTQDEAIEREKFFKTRVGFYRLEELISRGRAAR